MTTTPEDSFELNRTQVEAIRDLIRKLVQTANYHNRNRVIGWSGHRPLFANVFGVLGPRGAGKSTVVRELYYAWNRQESSPKRDLPPHACRRRPEIDEGLGEEFECLYFLPVMDCSVVPEEISPGTAVLLRLLKVLERDPKLESKTSELPGTPAELKDLVGRYSRAEKNYRELYLELSSTPEDYSQYVLDSLGERFSLGEDLADWLKEALRRIQRSAFVVLLDDFDLVAANEVREWMLALLDELHQSRILFVITADFFRLQYLSWDPKAQFDEKTGRALLDKLLPPQNRRDLSVWTFDDRGLFRFHGDDKELRELITPFTGKKTTFARLVESLLPSWPRGLENLYSSLAAADQADQDLEEMELLELLAISRNESLLARRLQECRPTQWIRVLEFPQSPLSAEDWQELTQTAICRARWSSEPLLPLRSLYPELPRNIDLGEGSRRGPVDKRVLTEDFSAPWKRDPSWHDPLRHDWLRLMPLRDADDRDTPLWTELLIDLGFSRSSRLRVNFISKWKPALHRFERSKLDLDVGLQSLREFFENNAANISLGTLYWMDRKGESRLAIGWHPLIEAARGARNPFMTELLSEILIDVHDLKDSASDNRGKASRLPEELWSLVPEELWALILLVDALDRCPWASFSSPLGWQFVTYLGLAAAFVRSAYAHALWRSEILPEKEFESEQRLLVHDLARSDPLRLLKMTEEDLLDSLVKLFDDGLAKKVERRRDALSRAAKAFLRCEPYLAVVTFVRHELEDHVSS